MSGKLYQKSILSQSLTKNQALALEILLLILAGVLISVLRAYLRIPMNIPGRQGIIVMALLISSRALSKNGFASSITMLGSSLMMFLPFMGFKDPYLPFIYIVLGISLDFLWRRFDLNTRNIFIAAFFGGIVYMLIPIIRFGLFSSSVFIYSEFLTHGFLIPVV